MPSTVQQLLFSALLSLPSLAMALSLGPLHLLETGTPFHAQITVLLADDESLPALKARLALEGDLPNDHHLSYPIHKGLALALIPLNDKQVQLDIRGDGEARRLPYSFLLQLQLDNGLVLKQYDVVQDGPASAPQVRETLLSHILTSGGSQAASEKAPPPVTNKIAEVEKLQQELAEARVLERDLKRQNKLLKDNIEHMEKLAGDIAQQLGLFAQMRQQQASGNSQPLFIDQNADSSAITGTTLGSISVLALLLVGFAFREKLKLTDLAEYIKRWSNSLFDNKTA